MAVDKKKVAEIVAGIESLIDVVLEYIPESQHDFAKTFLRDKLFRPTLEQLKVITESRPPTFFLMGRSGHGKSAIINALAGKQIAAENPIKPETANAKVYEISFDDSDAVWNVVDSRGIFETSKAVGAKLDDPVKALIQDIIDNNPDIILHVISAPEARTLEQDIKVVQGVRTEIKKRHGIEYPNVAILNKCDTLGNNPRHWPPEKYPSKMALIEDLIGYFKRDVVPKIESEGSVYVDIIPTSCAEPDLWNIDKLKETVFDNLPNTAWFSYAEGQMDQKAMMDVVNRVIRNFSNIAFGIGVTPLPFADLALLVPLQLSMILLIGVLAGKEPSKETLVEYLTALGLNLGAAFGLREIARGAIKFIPIKGHIISGGVSRQGTVAIGKSAEAYFFKGEIIKPDSIYDEAAASRES